MLIGVDEVGRGSWAGPLLVVAAIQTGSLPAGLTDSKKLTKDQRHFLFYNLKSNFSFGEGWVSASEIDNQGLTGAMKLGVARALEAIGAQSTDEIIMDGHINYCDVSFTNVRCIVKADASQPIVSAASIYAKVTRDKLMAKLAEEHPEYGFEKHVGYGTKAHIDALRTHGICKLHRISYKPVATFV